MGVLRWCAGGMERLIDFIQAEMKISVQEDRRNVAQMQEASFREAG